MRGYTELGRELIRALRGRRSQAQLSRRLGYRSNVVFDWEAGRRQPTAATALRIAERCGVDLRAALTGFFRPALGWPKALSPASASGVVRLLNDLRGNATILELSRATGISRFAIGRWLKGSTEPRLAEFLNFIEHTSLRLLDFIAALVDPSALPAVHDEWQQLTLTRTLAYDKPWSHAVLRALELTEYQALGRHRPGFIAEALGISPAEETSCLELLVKSAQVQRNEAGLYQVIDARTVDTRYEPTRSRQLRAFWAELAADRIGEGAEGEFAFNLFGVSSADLERLRALQRAYFRELRAIVASSEPVEHVVLTNIQMLPLSVGNRGHKRR